MSMKSILERAKGLLHKKGEEKKEDTTNSESSAENMKKMAEDKELLTKILESISSINKDVSEHFVQVENRITAIETKTDDDTKYKEVTERLQKVESTLGEFSKIYEMVTAQYSPFLSEEESQKSHFAQSNSPQQSSENESIQKKELPESESKDKSINDSSQEVKKPVEEPQKSKDAHIIGNNSVSKKQQNPTVESALHDLDESIQTPKLNYSSYLKYMQIQTSKDTAFTLQSQTKVYSLTELFLELYHMSDEEFSHYVTENKHDFAAWVKGSLHADDLAKELYECSSREECVKLLGNILESE